MTFAFTFAVLVIFLFGNSIPVHGYGVPQCLPTLASYLQDQQALLQSVKNDLNSTKQLLQQAIDKWPPGHYCILAKGPCPTGFLRSSGHMRALKIFASSAVYIKPATFGDSRIQCLGQPCGRYGQWIGELHITACCK
ncbi:uncharacterized protein [Acropora muricata]|uniref:uncharacterized protein n=1 Tax=Acropora muricata TaxID=159855 RepID=UPI0034E458BE